MLGLLSFENSSLVYVTASVSEAVSHLRTEIASVSGLAMTFSFLVVRHRFVNTPLVKLLFIF
jgi:hypothetical protein